MTDVVVVESPAKAKTINKYLGDGFTVLASFGHVRDLPPKDGSVRPAENFAMDWEADERGTKQVAAIIRALKGARTLYLATDPDREGEAISWHVRAMLEDKRALKGVDVQRITFNEITRTAVQLWTIWWGSPSRRCCGASCLAAAVRGACSRWRCAWCASAKPRSRLLSRANTGRWRRIF
jgi:hypothetical protein